MEGARPVTDSRDNVLAAVARGVRVGALPPDATLEHPGAPPPVARPADRESLVDVFTRQLHTLMGVVYRVADDEAAVAQVAALLEARGVGRVLAWDDAYLEPAGLGGALRARGVTLEPCTLPSTGPERYQRLQALDDVAVGLTGAFGALAETGSLVAVSGPGRGRIASLLPPVHIAVVRAEQLATGLGSFLAAHPEVADIGSNLVIITGPSRTGDIEGTLVLGVHGPGELHVVLIG
jgi:L-lactate dehydrogenase complex protein LldG